MRDSLRTKLVLWYVVVVTAIVAVFGTSVCYLFWRSLVRRADDELQSRAGAVARALRPAGAGAFDLDLLADTRDYFETPRADQPYYAIWTAAAGEVDVSDPDLPVPAPSAPGARTRDGRREIIVSGPDGARVLVGRPLGAEWRAVRALGLTVAIVGLGAVGLAVLCGWFLAGRALAPIARITRTARAMARGDLAARIPIDRTETELGQVALALNTAFDRLDAALERQRRFTADASHELRTPLATLQAETEWALARERSAAEYRESLETCRSATTRMRGLVEGLLTLARADTRELPLQAVPVAIEQVVRDVVTLARPVAERRQIRLITTLAPIEVRGDPEGLRQAVSNLVSNAIQYNVERGRVEIATALEDGTLVVRVVDNGVGIPAEHVPHLFERFYRVDTARPAGSGLGLGLALTKWIVDQHGGTIVCDSEPGCGTAFTVRLPGARLASAARPPLAQA
jgi:heavy metal sensor kinase